MISNGSPGQTSMTCLHVPSAVLNKTRCSWGRLNPTPMKCSQGLFGKWMIAKCTTIKVQHHLPFFKGWRYVDESLETWRLRRIIKWHVYEVTEVTFRHVYACFEVTVRYVYAGFEIRCWYVDEVIEETKYGRYVDACSIGKQKSSKTLWFLDAHVFIIIFLLHMSHKKKAHNLFLVAGVIATMLLGTRNNRIVKNSVHRCWLNRFRNSCARKSLKWQ